MLQKITRGQQRPRTTAPIGGTVEKTQVALDAASALALPWAQTWCRRQSALTHPASVVVRRALQHYCRHLQDLAVAQPEAVERELRCLRAAGDPMTHPPGTLQEALARLAAVPADQPLPPVSHLLNPDLAPLMARWDALLEQVSSRPTRSRSKRTTDPKENP